MARRAIAGDPTGKRCLQRAFALGEPDKFESGSVLGGTAFPRTVVPWPADHGMGHQLPRHGRLAFDRWTAPHAKACKVGFRFPQKQRRLPSLFPDGGPCFDAGGSLGLRLGGNHLTRVN